VRRPKVLLWLHKPSYTARSQAAVLSSNSLSDAISLKSLRSDCSSTREIGFSESETNRTKQSEFSQGELCGRGSTGPSAKYDVGEGQGPSAKSLPTSGTGKRPRRARSPTQKPHTSYPGSQEARLYNAEVDSSIRL
jgi:hypothetical protein